MTAEEGPARQRLGLVIDTMRRYWTGQRAVMTVHTFNGGMRALAEELARSGATVTALITSTPPGQADPPAEHAWSCARHGLSMSRDQFETWLAGQPPEITDWLDSLDPERTWPVLGTTYATFSELSGRRAHGRWRSEWVRFEDKTRIDELWQRLGIPAPPYALLAPGDPASRGAAAELDQGRGMIVAIDGTRDVLGSSQGLRWARDQAELDAALLDLRGRTERVRLAPFVPGVPCSAMAMVIGGEVAVFDPIEVITLYRPATGELVYCGTSTWWRPEPDRREQLRDYARTVGRELAASFGYAGIFSVDGILGEQGFFATELNPRHVSGLGLRAGWPEFPTRLLNRALLDGTPDVAGLRWQDVEDVFRDVIRRDPSCSLWVPLPSGRAAALGEAAGVISVKVTAGQAIADCEVRYRAEAGGIWILGAEGGNTEGTLGPVTAAVAAAFGAEDLRSCVDA